MNNAQISDKSSVLIFTIGSYANTDIQTTLISLGFQTWNCETQSDFQLLVDHRNWSLVLIDLPLFSTAVQTSCARIREYFSGPITVIIPRQNEDEQPQILESGIDDVILWPATPALLGARLRALLRRNIVQNESYNKAQAPMCVGDLVIDQARREVKRGDRTVSLTDIELELLQLLAGYAGATVSRELISRRLRGLPYDSRDRSIDLRISRLRKKLGDDSTNPSLILTVRGAGYQLAADAL